MRSRVVDRYPRGAEGSVPEEAGCHRSSTEKKLVGPELERVSERIRQVHVKQRSGLGLVKAVGRRESSQTCLKGARPRASL